MQSACIAELDESEERDFFSDGERPRLSIAVKYKSQRPALFYSYKGFDNIVRARFEGGD